MRNKILMLLLAIFTFAGNAYAVSPKREWRSTWLTTVWGLDWPSTTGTSASVQEAQKKEMTDYLDLLADMNMTSTCFQVRSMCDAMYKSSYEPWSSYLTGSRGADPGWDPLAFVVEECHKRGIECYAWVNPYRWSTGSDWNTAQDQDLVNKGLLLTHTTTIILNPGLPETRERIVNVCKEIISNYAVDGILFDDYFYPNGISANSSAEDYNLWKNSGTSLSFGNWRRANVNQMVKDVYEMVQSTRPDVRFGISPAGVAGKNNTHGLTACPVSASDWQYDGIYSDPLAWLEEGTIDFISPQIYWHTDHGTAPYEPLAKWWSYAANSFGRHHYASVSISDVAGDNTSSHWSEHNNQILLNRKYTENNAPGTCFYSTNNLRRSRSGLADYVIENSFTHKALTPVITWAKATNYGAVNNLKLNNGVLTWDAVTNGNAIIRYTVYAVPNEKTSTAAQMSDGDGFDAQYLQGVTYTNSYELSSDARGSFWYAVCVYDGYGNEHTAAVLNYPDGESKNTELVSPINGAATSWITTFNWTAVENASFTLEISDSDSFSNIIYREKEIASNSATLDLYLLEDAKTYYWRVITAQSGKLSVTSNVGTFTSPTRQNGPSPVLVSPENGAEIEDNCNFMWRGVDGDVDNYTLEISSSSDFSTVKYSKDIAFNALAENVSYEVSASLLGKGKSYWRVLTKGSHIKPGVSSVRSFTVTKISVGNTEAGYEIKLDKDSYSNVGTLSVNNLWHRSIYSDYANIKFESDGSLNRGMCVVGETVYVSGRSENSASASAYLRKYNASTGEHMGDLKLGSEATVGYYPCNDVVKDSKGNVCVTNLSLNASTTPLKVFMVNLETGGLTEVASISTSKTDRVDHAAIYGDVKAGNFKVYVGLKGTKNVVRWTYENGVQKKEETCAVTSFYTGSNFGIAPRLTIVDDNSFFIDGGAIPMTRYNFSTGAMIGSFKDNKALAPVGYEANGCTFFTLNGKKYVVYSYGDDETSTTNAPFTFNVVSTDDEMSFASMSLLWTLPKNGLGNVYSGTMQAPVDYVAVDDHTVRIYLYAPGCGLSCYEMKDSASSVIEEVSHGNLNIIVAGKRITLSENAESVEVFDVTGSCVAHAANVSELSLNVSSGVYVVVAKVAGNIYKKKILI